MKLIDKDALVAEINRVLNSYDPNEITSGRYALVSLRDFLDTLEVKEVDLDFTKEVDVWIEDNGDTNGFFNVQDLAKHFFELGLKAQHSELTWEDISVLRKIMAEYRRQTSNEMLVLNDEDYCKEVLNRFKAQKGE